MALTLDALRRRLLEQQEQDSSLNQRERDINLGVQRGEADALFGNQRDELEATRGLYELGRKRDFDLERFDETLADRGILRSGMNIEGRGRLGEEHTKNTEALSRRLSGSKEDRARALQRLKEDSQRQLADLNVERARIKTDREQQKAVDEAENQASQVAAQAEAAAAQKAEADRLAALQPQYTPTGQYLPPTGETPGGNMSQEEYDRQFRGFDINEWRRQNATKGGG